MPFKFEKLEIWKLAIEFGDEVHLLTRKFPKKKYFHLHHNLRGLLILFH